MSEVPPIISYATCASPPKSKAITIILVAALLFTLGDSVTEYVAQCAYLRHRLAATQPGTYRAMKLQDAFEFNLMIEGSIAVVAAILFTIAQLIAFPWRRFQVRKSWEAAVGIGMFFSLVRWGIYWIERRAGSQLSNGWEIMLAFAIAFCLGIALSLWRRVAKG